MSIHGIAFLDVEASSLRHGFPLEVGWCSADLLHGASFLIRPLPHWLDGYRWSREAEDMHGLTVDRLEREGLRPEEVVERLVADLNGFRVCSDNPAFDDGWLRLLRDPPPFEIDRERPPGLPAMQSTGSGLRPHRALDDAVMLAMAFASFAASGDRLAPEEALARGRALVERCGRR